MIASAAGTGFGTDDLPFVLLVGSLVLLVAVAAVRLANRSGLPTLLIYLAIGVVLGEGGFGIDFSNDNLTQVLGYAALVLILIEGGLTTEWRSIRSSVAPALLLSTLGVLVSVGVVGALTHWLLDLGWSTSLLLGAIVSSTDAAAVFSVLRKVPLPHRLTGVLEAESGFNDAPVVLLVVALASEVVPGGEHHTILELAGTAVFELAGGALVGLLVGWVLGSLSQRIAPGSSGLFAIGVVAGGVFAYAAAATVHTSGFIATYLAALVLGNMNIPHRQAVRGFGQALGWLAQIGLFVLLGLLASPSRLADQLVPAIVVGFVLLLIARPASVLVSMTPFGFSWREQVFVLGRTARRGTRRSRDRAPDARRVRHAMDLRPRLRARHRLHPAAGPDPALRRQTPRHRRASPHRRAGGREHAPDGPRCRHAPGQGGPDLTPHRRARLRTAPAGRSQRHPRRQR